MRQAGRIALPVLAVTALVALVFGVTDGVEGVLGAALGGVVVILFLGSTPVVLTPLVKASAALSLPVALTFLATKSVAVLVVLVLLFDVGGAADQVDPTAFGVAAIAASLAWTVLQIVAFRNERVPTYDLKRKD
jgi:ATP synthase protein I